MELPLYLNLNINFTKRQKFQNVEYSEAQLNCRIFKESFATLNLFDKGTKLKVNLFQAMADK